MKTAKFLAAAAFLTATMATPTLAQDRMTRDQAKENARVRATQTIEQRSVDDRGYWRSSSNDDWNRDNWNRSNTGFWPGDVAANVVGGAVTTAGAIATAPFRGGGSYYGDNWNNDSYAYYGDSRVSDESWNSRYNNSYQGRVARVYRGAEPTFNGSFASNSVTSSYAERNGFVCQPGAWFTGSDGREHICQ